MQLSLTLTLTPTRWVAYATLTLTLTRWLMQLSLFPKKKNEETG
jgi:hypothetical protein